MGGAHKYLLRVMGSKFHLYSLIHRGNSSQPDPKLCSKLLYLKALGKVFHEMEIRKQELKTGKCFMVSL